MNGGQRQTAELKMLANMKKAKNRVASPMRAFRATVPVGNTRAIERAKLTRHIQKTMKYNARFTVPELSTLNGVVDPAELERLTVCADYMAGSYLVFRRSAEI
jgi:hypothetical protein